MALSELLIAAATAGSTITTGLVVATRRYAKRTADDLQGANAECERLRTELDVYRTHQAPSRELVTHRRGLDILAAPGLPCGPGDVAGTFVLAHRASAGQPELLVADARLSWPGATTAGTTAPHELLVILIQRLAELDALAIGSQLPRALAGASVVCIEREARPAAELWDEIACHPVTLALAHALGGAPTALVMPAPSTAEAWALVFDLAVRCATHRLAISWTREVP
jgi:hypothetical protein